MAQSIKKIRALAQEEFLGWESVVGVGIEGIDEDTLVILLARDVCRVRTKITNWAHEHGVGVTFVVTGKIKSSLGVGGDR